MISLPALTRSMNRTLLISAAAYLAMLPSNAWTFARSFAFTIAASFAFAALMGSWLGKNEETPSPGRAILVAYGLWTAWAIASLAWSIHPAYSAGELRREIAWGTLTALTFYMAARNAHAWRVLVATALIAFGIFAAGVLLMAAMPGGWIPDRWHSGIGPYAMHLVLIAPLLLTLLSPAPTGFRAGWRSVFFALVLLGLLLATARLTENRIVWLALAATFGTTSLLAALRWHHRVGNSYLRWLAPLLALMLVLGALFIDAARERAQNDFPPRTSVARTLSDDPRFSLWDHTVKRIRERPLLGYGFGRAILADELRQEMQNPLLSHAHNIFVSQFLQMGAVGFTFFLALLVALIARFAGFVRSSDDSLAFIGVLGIALIVGFVVKNLTDDFLFRSNAKELWATLGLLLGLGVRRARRVSGGGVRGP